MVGSFFTILVYSSLQLICFSVILALNKKYGSKANQVLAFLLVLIGISLLLFSMNTLGWIKNLFLLDAALAFGGAPLLYFYVRTYLTNAYAFRTRHLLHLIPLLIEIVLWAVLILPLPLEEKLLNGTGNNVSFEAFNTQREVFFVIQTAFYLFLIYKAIKAYHSRAKEIYSYSNNDVLRWFYGFIGLFLILPLIISFIAFYFSDAEYEVLAISFSFFSFLIMIIVLMRPEIYRGIGIIAPATEASKANVSFSEEEKEKLFQRLLTYMDTAHPYLNPQLTLKSLSEALGTNPNYLSQSINSLSQSSFFDFINGYRISRAKEMLLNEEFSKYTVEGIAAESGFRSKSAFYNSFKKINGISPIEFKHQKA